jgi:Ca2+-binding EF-hand superfamily protein
MLLALVAVAQGSLVLNSVLQGHHHEEGKHMMKHSSTLLHDIFDKDEDGHLTREELTHLLEQAEEQKLQHKINKERQSLITEEQKAKFFGGLNEGEGIDRRHDGWSAVNLGFGPEEKEEMGEYNWAANNLAFRVYDVDNSGLLDEEEFMDFHRIKSKFRELHEAFGNDVKAFSAYWHGCDTNKDDKVSLEEVLHEDAGSHPKMGYNREIMFKLCDTNMDGFLETNEWVCFEDPLPETKGEYHALGVLAMENFEEGKHADKLDNMISKKELEKLLSFKKANQMLTKAIKHYHKEEVEL